MNKITNGTLLIHLRYSPTTKRRLNITLTPDEYDKAFSLLAEKRLKEKGKKLTHTEVWDGK